MIRLFTFFIVLFSLSNCQQAKDTSKATAKENTDKPLVSPSVVEGFEGAKRTAYQQPEKVMDYIGDVKGQTIMDLGAGTGYFTFRLAKAGAYVIAADIFDKYLNYMKLKADSLNLSHLVELRKVPKNSPDLQPNEIDKFLIVNTYHHVYDRSKYFEKVKNGLTKNGEVIIIDFFKRKQEVGPSPHYCVSYEKVIEELKEAGFTEFEVEKELLEYQYIVKAL